MESRIFNSVFEMSLRLLLLLSVRPKTFFYLQALIRGDYISCYAQNFGFPFKNLHGENKFSCGELANRSMLAREAIKSLVVQGWVDVQEADGYQYRISREGRIYVEKLHSTYSQMYREIAKEVMSQKTDIEIHHNFRSMMVAEKRSKYQSE